MTQSSSSRKKVPEEVEKLLVDVTDVNRFIMSLDPRERRRFTKELKSWLAMIIVAQKSSGKQPDIQKIAEMLRLGFDKSHANEEIMLLMPADGKTVKTLLTCIQSMTILQHGLLIVTRSGLEIIVPFEVLSGLREKYGRIYETFRGLVGLEIVKKKIQKTPTYSKTILVTRKVKPLVSEVVNEEVKQLYHKYLPIDLYLYLLGIEPSVDSIYIMLPKLLPWFIVENEPIHCAVFEPPETGKTHTCIVMATVCNYYYTTEPPSKAFFIHDARKKTSESIVSMYEGIILDEAEKTMSKDAYDWEEFLAICMTGMEQGKWPRSKGEGITIEKMFTIVYQGNTLETGSTTSITDAFESETETKTDTRRMFIDMVRRYIKNLNVAGIASRLTYVTWRTQCNTITNYLLNRFAPTPILRGLWRLIQDNIDKVCTEIKPQVRHLIKKITGKELGTESRVFRHIYKITTLLHVLFRYPVTEDLVDKAIQFVKYGELDVTAIEELYETSETEKLEEKQVESLTTVEAEKEELQGKEKLLQKLKQYETEDKSEPPFLG